MYISIMLALALGVLALIFVLYPLFRSRFSETPRSDAQAPVEDKEREREQAARSALQEVELDFQLGNIAETDYRALRERYMRRALVSLKSRYEHDQALDDEIEEQLRKMKETKNDDVAQ
jgi:flagellar biosynthesis/type III secretory pathway M-ring protein FliF/YscJ